MEFKKKAKISTEIPTASMPDIVFMLLLFFMVATVFRQYQGLPVDLPVAKKIVKLEAKKNVTHIYASSAGEISIDDKIISRNRDIRSMMYKKRVENPRTMVSLKADQGAPMKDITDIQQELREADVLPINYTAKYGD